MLFDPDQLADVFQRGDQQLARQPRLLLALRPVARLRDGRGADRGVLGDAQRATQTAHADHVGAAERAGQQLLGRRLVELGGVHRDLEQGEQRPHTGLGGQRQLIGRHHDGDARGRQRPAQRRKLADGRADQHGHPPPRHALKQVSAAQGVGHHGGLLAGAAGEQHLDLARPVAFVAPGRDQVAVALDRRDGEAGGETARGLEDRRRHAAAHPQRDHRRGGAVAGAEALGEVEDGVDVGAAEAVDGLVGVADDDQIAAVAGEVAQQGLLRGVGVLVFVDQHDVVGGAFALADRAVGEQRGRGADQIGVVEREHRIDVETGVVTPQEAARRHPVGAAVQAAQLGQVVAVEAALRGAGQEVTQLLREPAGGEDLAHAGRPVRRAVLQLAVEQAADLHELFGRGEQARRLLAGEDGLAAQQRIGVGVEGEGERGARGAAQAGGDTLPELAGRLPAEGEHQDALGVHTAPFDTVDDGLHYGGRLAGAGTRQHEQRARLVRHHGTLMLIQLRRRGGRRPPTAHQPPGLTTHSSAFHQTTGEDRATLPVPVDNLSRRDRYAAGRRHHGCSRHHGVRRKGRVRTRPV